MRRETLVLQVVEERKFIVLDTDIEVYRNSRFIIRNEKKSTLEIFYDINTIDKLISTGSWLTVMQVLST